MLTKVNLKEAVDSVGGLFEYMKIGQINSNMLNVLQAENRTLDFHIHEKSDELFYVIEGDFEIELDDGVVPLTQGDMLIIPKGIRHRPVVKTLVKCLLVELEGALNSENTGDSYLT